MNFQFSSESLSFLPGLPLFEKAFPARITAGGELVQFEPGRDRPGFSVTQEEKGFRVHYARPCDAYRALGLLLAADLPPKSLSQDCVHESVGVMWDLSRNAVMRPEALEELFQKFALLGINSVQLYMEDVYEIPGEPFFGYGRGAYSAEELRRIDEYGRQLGIEVTPWIQTLGHLDQILQWPPYRDCTDVPGVLMVGEEKTRQLIGKMLDQMAACFQSRNIHIGMDEAHGLGLGQYLQKNGFQRRFDILNRHLQMVTEMCRERGLQPMIWSDMYFRIGSAKNDYYDQDSVIPAGVASQIPENVSLVYWDYYHTDPAFYEEWIRRHRAMGKEPVFAAGAWNWLCFWAYEPQWRATLDAGMKAARAQKLAQTVMTIWGDDGAQFHPASVLPAIQRFAEWAYVGEPDDRTLEKSFAPISYGSSLGDYLRASQLDEDPGVRGLPNSPGNYSNWILWHDPVLGFLNAHITSDMPGHYRELADTLDQPDADDTVRFAVKVARAVALKSELHLKARPAWKAGDRKELLRLNDNVLPECLRAVRELWQAHREMWHQWQKPFGWEVLERRYLGCLGRLESLGILLGECLQNPETRVPEWEFDPLPVTNKPTECYYNYHHSATPSALK